MKNLLLGLIALSCSAGNLAHANDESVTELGNTRCTHRPHFSTDAKMVIEFEGYDAEAGSYLVSVKERSRFTVDEVWMTLVNKVELHINKNDAEGLRLLDLNAEEHLRQVFLEKKVTNKGTTLHRGRVLFGDSKSFGLQCVTYRK